MTTECTHLMFETFAKACEPNAPVISTGAVHDAITDLLGPRHMSHLSNWQVHCLYEARRAYAERIMRGGMETKWALISIERTDPAPIEALRHICEGAIRAQARTWEQACYEG